MQKLTRVQIFFILMSVFAFIVAMTVELTDNETYYWSWSLQPDISYFDHPPLLAWMLWLTTHLFGKTVLAIRLPALISFWICNFLFARWMKRFEIPWENAIALCIGAPLFFVFSWITLPDILFLPLALFAIDCLYRRQFFWTGVCLGVCILAKWHGLFLIPGIAVAILFMEMSFAQKVKNIFLIVGTALALQYPVLLWNYQHDWVSFKYHLVNRHRGEWGTVLHTFGNGVGFLAGFVALSGASFIYLIAKYLRHPTKKDHNDYVLLAMGIPFLLVFGLSALKGESRIYWASFAFFPLSIFLLRKLPTMVQQRLQQISVVSCVLCMIGLSVGLYLPVGAYSRPVVELFRTYDMRLSPRGDTLGWKEWAKSLSNEKILYVAADMRLASQLMWNSNLNFDQVTVIRPIKQYSIWQRPDIKNFAKVVFFGDNRRKLKGNQMDYVCPGPKTEKEYLNVRLLSEVVKVIEEVECTSNLVAN